MTPYGWLLGSITWASMLAPGPSIDNLDVPAPTTEAAIPDKQPEERELVVGTEDPASAVSEEVLGIIEEEAKAHLRTLDEVPKSLTLRVQWNDREAMEYGIELKIGADELAASCPKCSEGELAGRVLALLDEAIAEMKAKREKETQQPIIEEPPPPLVHRPAEPPTPTDPDPDWKARRGVAVAMMAAGGAAVIIGGGISTMGTKKKLIEKTPVSETHRIHDYRTAGYVTLGVGAIAIVGGLTWLLIEQRRKRVHERAPASRIRPGIGMIEVRF